MGNNKDAVRRFLQLLEEKDIERWLDLWADDADHYYPFGQQVFPAHLKGKEEIYERWRNMPGNFETLKFPLHEAWEDGDTVIARFSGDTVMKDGLEYRNAYISTFRFDDGGKIREYREYFDPIVAGEAFGLLAVQYLGAGA